MLKNPPAPSTAVLPKSIFWSFVGLTESEMTKLPFATPTPLRATLIVGLLGSSVSIINVSLRLPFAVGSKVATIVQVSELFAAIRLLPVETLTAWDSLLLSMLLILKLVPDAKRTPFCATLRSDLAAELLSVKAYETDAFPLPSLMIEPKLIALSVDEPTKSATLATDGNTVTATKSRPPP